MFLSATPEVQVETAGNDVSYLFPQRPLGILRLFGLLLVGFSVLFVWSPVGSLVGTFRKLSSQPEAEGFGFIPLVAELIFVVAGCLPAVLGLLIAFGRCRVDWRDERLSVLDYIGPIRWRRRFPKNPVRKLMVNFSGTEARDQPVNTSAMANLGALTAEFETGGSRLVIAGYPREWLYDLARDLSMHVGGSLAVGAIPRVEVVNEKAIQADLADAPKPADTRINLESRINGLLIEVPPAGLTKGSGGLFNVSVVWCLFLTLITVMPLFKNTKVHGPFWIVVPGFWLVGLGLMTIAISLARRRATLVVEGGKLSVTLTSLFGTKQREWQRTEISAIRADASGMEVNNRPVIELQLHPVTGKKFGMLAWRNEAELRWLATELRRALNVPAQR